MDATEKYEIGGICVAMTREQADAWNRGAATSEVMAGAKVCIPSRVGASNRVSDGVVVVDDGLPTTESIDLWEAIGADGEPTALYAEYMADMPANRIQ